MVQKEQISRKTEEEEAQKWRVWLRGGTYVFGMLVLAMGLTLNTKAMLTKIRLREMSNLITK